MKHVGVLANCQVKPIQTILSSSAVFAQDHTIVPILPVHLISAEELETTARKIYDLDVLITQPVLDAARFGPLATTTLHESAPSSLSILKIPAIFYDGYFPTFGPIPGLKSSLNFVHDYFITACFLRGLSVDQCIERLENDYMEEAEIDRRHTLSLRALKKREADFEVDVPISNHIEYRYAEEQLLFTFNHPTNTLVTSLCNDILEKLGYAADACPPPGELLAGVHAPVYQPIRKALGLKWESPVPANEGNCMSLREMVEGFYLTYRSEDGAKLRDVIQKRRSFLLEQFGL